MRKWRAIRGRQRQRECRGERRTPRTPVNASANGDCHGGGGSRCRSEGDSQLAARVTPCVTGNATFVAGSTFVININGQGQNDKIAVGGRATLNGGTVNVNAQSGTGITSASTFTILTAQAGIAGNFANVTTSSNLAFLMPSTVTRGNSVLLIFGPQGAFVGVATTPTQVAVANAVQALGLGPVFNAVIGQSAAGGRQALDALSGDIHASVVTAAYQDALLPSAAILDRLKSRSPRPCSARPRRRAAPTWPICPRAKGRVSRPSKYGCTSRACSTSGARASAIGARQQRWQRRLALARDRRLRARRRRLGLGHLGRELACRPRRRLHE